MLRVAPKGQQKVRTFYFGALRATSLKRVLATSCGSSKAASSAESCPERFASKKSTKTTKKVQNFAMFRGPVLNKEHLPYPTTSPSAQDLPLVLLTWPVGEVTVVG